MKDYKNRAAKIIARRDAVLAERRRRRKAVRRYSAPAAVLCAAAALYIGSAVYWNNGTVSDTADMITAGISTEMPAVTQSAVSSDIAVTTQSAEVTTVTYVSVTDKAETQLPISVLDEYDYEDIAEDEKTPEETREIPEKKETAPPAEQTDNTVTVPTEAVTQPSDREPGDVEYTVGRLAETDDPISVFSVINYDGKEYAGYSYMKQRIADSFYVPWKEEAELTAYDEKKGREVIEPVTIHGLREMDEEQQYIIVCFENYGLYGLYASEESSDDSEVYNSIDNE